MARLTGKVALITGAAHGMGAAEARLFVEEGAHVLLTDIDPQGEELASELGQNAAFARHDVSSEENWATVVAAVEKHFGRLDILVNNAGILVNGSLEETDVETFERAVRINQLGPYLGMRAVVEPMVRAGGGSIVNISSSAGLRGSPGLFAYSTTKWAVRGMTKCAAMDLAHWNIRVNSIHPGPIDTTMIQAITPELKQVIMAGLPSKRFGAAEEVARAVLFLASDEASYMTGAELAVDGGVAI